MARLQGVGRPDARSPITSRARARAHARLPSTPQPQDIKAVVDRLAAVPLDDLPAALAGFTWEHDKVRLPAITRAPARLPAPPYLLERARAAQGRVCAPPTARAAAAAAHALLPPRRSALTLTLLLFLFFPPHNRRATSSTGRRSSTTPTRGSSRA